MISCTSGRVNRGPTRYNTTTPQYGYTMVRSSSGRTLFVTDFTMGVQRPSAKDI